MNLNLNKKGIRALGIAESFRGREWSILSGVVMRGDLRIDGVGFARIKVGGMDATEGVLKIYRDLNRRDIGVLLLGGSIVSWFNIIDLDRVHDETGLPLICITYEASEGLEEHIRKHFEDRDLRLEAYQRLGTREEIQLENGYTVYVRYLGLSMKEASIILNRFTVDGRRPEPVKVARLMARSMLNVATAYQQV